MTFEQNLREIGEEILEKIGSRSSTYFLRGGGLPSPSQVTDRTGGLLDSIMGGANSIREIEISSDSAKFTIGSNKPYAALQEKGGVRIVTEKMRKFFWAKYLESNIIGDTIKGGMWSALRFKNSIVFPARPYLEPAVKDVVVDIPDIFKRHTMEYLRLTITETINEHKK
jgi:phage gpG-like protein